MIIVGTMAVAITIGSGIWSDETSTGLDGKSGALRTKDASVPAQHQTIKESDSFLTALGVKSDEEVYDALYNGRSLADIAAANYGDVQSIIDLQIDEMTQQLNQRLANGSLTPDKYEAQKAELKEIITSSVYGQKLPAESV
jgi:hypothetical protein